MNTDLTHSPIYVEPTHYSEYCPQAVKTTISEYCRKENPYCLACPSVNKCFPDVFPHDNIETLYDALTAVSNAESTYAHSDINDMTFFMLHKAAEIIKNAIHTINAVSYHG